LVEAPIQPIVKPMVSEIRETVVQPVVMQPKVVEVAKAPIENAPIHRFTDAGIRMAAPIEASAVPAGLLPAVRSVRS
jgi:hypothetical protein